MQIQGRLIEVAMVMKKVDIRLSMAQFTALGRIMSSFLGNMTLSDVDDKALFYLLYHFYEGKIRKKMLSLKTEVKLSLDMPMAWAIAAMLQDMDLDAYPYESNVKLYILSEIDHQTA